jgi:hypothetical protein
VELASEPQFAVCLSGAVPGLVQLLEREAPAAGSVRDLEHDPHAPATETSFDAVATADERIRGVGSVFPHDVSMLAGHEATNNVQ